VNQGCLETQGEQVSHKIYQTNLLYRPEEDLSVYRKFVIMDKNLVIVSDADTPEEAQEFLQALNYLPGKHQAPR
jgi:hypothetical protein